MLDGVSIVTGTAPGLSISPRVVVGQRWLTARTHRLWSLLSLFSYERELHVDAIQSQIRLRERKWWRVTETRIAIDAVDHIEYRYVGLPTSFFMSYPRAHPPVEAADRVDRFAVGLVLKNGEHLPLFTFLGEGAVTTGAVGVLFGDDWLDLEGQQEQEARGFVEHLVRLTKLGLGPTLPRQAAERRGTRCPACGQLNAPRALCLYCGAGLPARASRAPDG